MMSFPLIATGVLIHFVLIYSIFDIYYTSPVISGVPAHEITRGEAPARRLVVISADGLRWDTFDLNPSLSPFLHGIIRDRKGMHGVSRSHVPTESRPGHVAMFAGFTEDVSAVAMGWKKNPVPFDSVLNRSLESWLWGSPDIVSLFDNHPHIHSHHYAEEEEDFGTDKAYLLDKWVFDHVETFLKNSQQDKSELERLSEPRKVFFLHLLGLDTNGHGNKPHSKQYKENVKVVDDGIRRIQTLFDETFTDKRTAWIFTSDHGMTDWGSHGAGSDEEVLTPYVVWGSGIREGGPKNTISQVDLAPLMSTLIGVPIPVNSIGILPVPLLATTPAYLFKAALANFRQLKEQILTARGKKSHRIGFRDYETFGDRALAALETELLKLGKLNRHGPAASLFVENAPLMNKAIYYYHRYDQGFLGAAVSLIFMSWISLVWAYLTLPTSKSTSSVHLVPKMFFKLLLIAVALFCVYCRLPLTNYVYIILPVYLVSVLDNIGEWSSKLESFIRDVAVNYATMNLTFLVEPFLLLLGTSLSLFFCVMVFIDRRCLSLIFLALFLVPYMYSTKSETLQKFKKIWRICCIALLPFPFLPSVGRTEIPSLCVISPLVLGLLLLNVSKTINKRNLNNLSFICFGCAFVLFSCRYLFETVPSVVRLFCWISLPLSVVLPLFSSVVILDRLLIFMVALFVPYSFLSIAYESLFLLLFYPLLLLFLRFEFGHLSDAEFMLLSADSGRPITKFHGKVLPQEIRRTLICVAFVLSGLFGTGNFASLNSFNPSALNLFITVFSPFTMATLLIGKLIIPLLIVAFFLASVLRFDRNSVQRLSCLVLILTDLMAMCFFHQLRDDGSWLDIGLSISQYLVAMGMSVAVLLLLLSCSFLMTLKLSPQCYLSSRTKEKDAYL